MLSLIETAIELTGGRISGGDLRELIALAKQMLTEEMELSRGARNGGPLGVAPADAHHEGRPAAPDLEARSLRASARPSRRVEVVSHKTPEVYAGILERQGVEAPIGS